MVACYLSSETCCKKVCSVSFQPPVKDRMTSSSLVARLRTELLTKITTPNNAKPSSLRSWLCVSQLVISSLLKELKEESEFSVEQSFGTLLNQEGVWDETFVVLQINLTIRQLFPDTFISALIAHARYLFKSWLRSPSSSRLISVMKEFELCKKFGWTDLYRQNYTDILHQAIEQRVDLLCKGEYQTEFLPELRSFVNERILPFAMNILSQDKKVNLQSDNENNSKLKILFQNSLLHAMSKSKAKELFEIVADFPDSIIAIKELKEAANKTSNMPYIGERNNQL